MRKFRLGELRFAISLLVMKVLAGMLVLGLLTLGCQAQGSNQNAPMLEDDFGDQSLSKTGLPAVFDAYVISVTDGNWFEARRGGQHVSVKLYGVRCADRKTGMGLLASEELGKMIYGRTVNIQRVGFYVSGGIIALVKVDDTNINVNLVRRGLGQARLYFDHLPRTNYWLRNAEAEAKREGLGLWQRTSK